MIYSMNRADLWAGLVAGALLVLGSAAAAGCTGSSHEKDVDAAGYRDGGMHDAGYRDGSMHDASSDGGGRTDGGGLRDAGLLDAARDGSLRDAGDSWSLCNVTRGACELTSHDDCPATRTDAEESGGCAPAGARCYYCRPDADPATFAAYECLATPGGGADWSPYEDECDTAP